MKLSPKHQQLIDFAKQHNGIITTTQAGQLLGGCYYHNSAKHVQEILSRLVKNGAIERIRLGAYRIVESKNIQTNQKELF